MEEEKLKKYTFYTLAALLFPISLFSPTGTWIPIISSSIILFLLLKEKHLIFKNLNKVEYSVIIFLFYFILSIIWTNNIKYALSQFFVPLILFVAYRVLYVSSQNFIFKKEFLNIFSISFLFTTLFIFLDKFFLLGIKPWISNLFDVLVDNNINNNIPTNYFLFLDNYSLGLFSGAYNRALATLSIFLFIVVLSNFKNKFIKFSSFFICFFTILIGESLTAIFAIVISIFFMLATYAHKKLTYYLLFFILSFYIYASPKILNTVNPNAWTEKKQEIVNSLNYIENKIQDFKKEDSFNAYDFYVLKIKQKFFLIKNKLSHRQAIWSFSSNIIYGDLLKGKGLFSSRKIGEENTIHLQEFNPEISEWVETSYPAIPLHPHNNTLQIWLELGVIGITLYFIIIYIIVKTIFFSRNFNKIKTSLLLGGVLCIFIINQSSYGAWQVWWLAILTYFAFVSRLISEQKH